MAAITTEGAAWGGCALLSGAAMHSQASSVMPTLEALRSALAAIQGVTSCKVGLEENICPDDYPIVRIVPSRINAGETYRKRKADVLIYFGVPIQPFDDTADAGGRVFLEKVYAALFSLEESIRAVVRAQGGAYRETITDEDRLETYKMMAVRCEVEI